MKKKPSSRYFKNHALNAIYRIKNGHVHFYSFSSNDWVELGRESYLHKEISYHDIEEITEEEAFVEIL